MNTLSTIAADAVGSSSLVLAQIESPNDALSSPIGSVITGLLLVIGVIVVVAGVLSAFKHIASGKIGKAATTLIAAGAIAAFMFFPELLISLVSIVQNIIEAIFGTADQITENNGGNG